MNRQNERGIALITTLIMLSLVTFLSVAFLTLTRQERATVQVQTEITVAEAMGKGAVDRAVTETVTQMLSANSRHSYDLIVSTNYERPGGLIPGDGTLGNASYRDNSLGDYEGGPLNFDDTLTNLLNLYFNPRVPVYVNADRSRDVNGRETVDRSMGGQEFRFYIDFNRNGQFEPTRLVFNTNAAGMQILPATLVDRVGDPQWIGILDRSNWRHGPDNRFVGRYAYLVMPTGKSLDINRIHNQARLLGQSSYFAGDEGYRRNQGVGDWELNMAGFLVELNGGVWNPVIDPYDYQLYFANNGRAFTDARDLSRARYQFSPSDPFDFGNLYSFGEQYPLGSRTIPQSYFWQTADRFDIFANGPLNIGPNLRLGLFSGTGVPLTGDDSNLLDPTVDNSPWFGSPMPSPFFEVQELLKQDPAATTVYQAFTDRLVAAMRTAGHHDRYTLYRLMAQMGTDSHEPIPNKYDLNYLNFLPENTSGNIAGGWTNYNRPQHFHDMWPERQNGFVPWLQGNTNHFFGFVADTLLKKRFGLSFNDTWANNQGLRSSIAIPVWDTNTPNRLLYSSAIHQTLQLAANIYDSTTGQNYPEWQSAASYASGNRVLFRGIAYEVTGSPSVGLSPNQEPAQWMILPHMPSVFRPQFDVIRDSMNNVVRVQITNYVQAFGTNYLVNRWYDLTDTNRLTAGSNNELEDFRNNMALASTDPNYSPNANVLGVPMVVGAKKGLPNFNEMGLLSRVTVGRKIEIAKTISGTNRTFQTNLMYTLGVTNRIIAEAWNSYTQAYPNPLQIHFRHAVQGQITNTGGTILKTFNSTAFATNYTLGPNFWGGGFFVPLGSRTETLMGGEQFVRSGIPDYFVPIGSGFTNRLFDRPSPSVFDSPDWHLTATHRMAFWIVDTAQNQVIDVVGLNDLTSYFDLTRTLLDRTSLSGLWETNRPGGTNDITVPTFGILEQLLYAGGYRGISTTEWEGYEDLAPTAEQAASFRTFFNRSDTRTNMQAPFEALRSLFTATSWGANDPLVHYTREDLSDPNRPVIVEVVEPPNSPTILTNNFAGLNTRYSPWGGRRVPGNAVGTNSDPEHIAYNHTLKDPGVRWPDDWDFPTYKMAHPGWLGRVHRGTPWQTVYLKAHMAPLIEPNGLPDLSWRRWAGTSLTHPTNDWELMDLFTAAPTPSAAQGLLSINQTNSAAWYAALSGLMLLSNSVDDIDIGPLTNGFAGDGSGLAIRVLDPREAAVRRIVDGIQRYRSQQQNGVFTNLGQILGVAELSIGETNASPLNQNPVSADVLNSSPYIYRGILGDEFYSEQEQYGIPDYVYERLPQQLMGLLKMEDHPRLTVYSWGQALKPARRSVILTAGPTRGLVTNYQVTAEVAAKSSVLIEGVNPTFTFATNNFRSLYEIRNNPQNVPVPSPPVFDLIGQDRIRIGRIAFRLRHSQRMMGRIDETPVRLFVGNGAGDQLPLYTYAYDPDGGGPLAPVTITERFQPGRTYYIMNARADDFQLAVEHPGNPQSSKYIVLDLLDIGQGFHRITTVPRAVVEDHNVLFSE